MFNVKAPPYGATGGGLVADDAAVQRALGDAQRAPGWRVVYFPAGVYLLSRPLVVESSQVRGCHRGGRGDEGAVVRVPCKRALP